MGDYVLELGGFACAGEEEEVVDRVRVESRNGGGWHFGWCLMGGDIELWGLWIGGLWRLVMDLDHRILQHGR